MTGGDTPSTTDATGAPNATDAADDAPGTTDVADTATDDSLDSPDDADPRILVIDDEKRVGQAFALWLDDGHRVETATSGEEGLEKLTDDVDVVLLDRHMPGLSGSEVLERIREAGYDCRIAMVTAVDPDFDIVDLPFDDYVSKPVDREALRAVVDRLLTIDQYDRRMGELYAVDRTVAALEADTPGLRVEDDERYRRLCERKAELAAETQETVASMDAAEVSRLFEAAVGDSDTAVGDSDTAVGDSNVAGADADDRE